MVWDIAVIPTNHSTSAPDTGVTSHKCPFSGAIVLI